MIKGEQSGKSIWTTFIVYEPILIPLFLISLAPILANYFSSELYSFLVFIMIFCIFSVRGYDSRLLIGSAIILLTVSAVELAWGSENYANLLSIWAYYFLVAGVLSSLVEYIRESGE